MLDATARQIKVGLAEGEDPRVEDALIDAEEVVDSARIEIADAAEAIRDEQEATGEAERERQRWRPSYHGA